MLMLFGKKNVGKTMTQQLIHFRLGVTSLSHGMVVAEGNSYTSGTSM